MAETILYAQLLLRAVKVEVRVNDLPIVRTGDEGMKTVARPIREFVQRGKNQLDLIIEPGLDPARSDTPPARPLKTGAGVRLRIAEFEDGEFMDFDSGHELVKIQSLPESDQQTPIVLSATFEIDGSPMADWAWMKAPLLDLDSVRDQLNQSMKRIARLFANKEADKLLQLMKPRMRDDAKAYPAMDLQQRIDNFRHSFATIPENWRPLPFDADRAVYRLVADGRLIEPLDRQGLPLIRTETTSPEQPFEDPDYVPFPIMVGLRKDRFAIYR